MIELGHRVAVAVEQFWRTRHRQAFRQRQSGRLDQGARSAVTGGRQLDGFARLVADVLVEAGVPSHCIYFGRRSDLFLPGFFRPSKQWDLVIVIEQALVAAIELKSHVGPSFGNNFNNRAEEAVGSATDLWTAYREGAFSISPRPWLGFFLLLETSPKSTRPLRVYEPHLPVFPAFHQSSYRDRYREFGLRLLRERLYDGACLICSDPEAGLRGEYEEPSSDLSFERFMASLLRHTAVCLG